MARQKGMLNLSGNIEVNAGAPFDARDIVPTLADLTTASNFPYPYIGMETYVVNEDKKYRLIGNDVTQSENWEEVGSGGGSTYTAGDGIEIDENNEISTDNMPSEDMSEIVSPLPGVMSRRMKYSTDEQVVGEWIDGKPLYQKVVDFGTVSKGEETTKDITLTIPIASVERVIKSYGMACQQNTANTFEIPGILELNCQVGLIWVVETNNITGYLRLTGSSASPVFDHVYATIYYTKTTDTAS